jgi:hypothetical protein
MRVGLYHAWEIRDSHTNFVFEKSKGMYHFGDLNIDETVILKWNLGN